MFYPDEVIEEVRRQNDIVDIVGSYVRLKRTGSNYQGLCPFHNEKSPSFSVSPVRQIYKCFGCGKGGNVITFLMEYESISFSEAVVMLAERAGITLPTVSHEGRDNKYAEKRTKLLEIYKEAATYYYKVLRTPEGRDGYNYLADRGLSKETMSRFGLGFAPARNSELYKILIEKGYEDSLLKESELFTYTEKDGARDKFWNRVMYPIMDINGKVIAFGGRVMGDAKPKYINSNETPIFDKSKNLFAMNIARRSKEDYFLLCEGYMDVISLHQAGFDNAVASLGTALTGLQAKLMARYQKNKVIITYDSDEAGTKAALRAIPILKEAGITTRVLNMKPYKDPDEFIKALGREAYHQRIEEAVPSFYFELDCMEKEYDLSNPSEQTKLYHQIAKRLLEFEEEVERTTYIKAVSARYDIKYDEFRRLVAKVSSGEVVVKGAREYVPVNIDNIEKKAERLDVDNTKLKAESLILTWCLENPVYVKVAMKHLSPNDFQPGVPRRVCEETYRLAGENETIEPAKIMNLFETAAEQKLVGDLFQTTYWSQLAENKEAVNRAFVEAMKQMLEESINRQMAEAASARDNELIRRMMKEKSEFSSTIQRISAEIS